MSRSSDPRARSQSSDGYLIRYVGIAIAVLLGLTGALVATGPAGAASGPFSIDGTIPDTGSTALTDEYGNVKEVGPKNASSTKIGTIHAAAVPMLDRTNPNAQVDLRKAWIRTAKGTETNPHDWLYIAWERDASSGSGFIAYEFMQDKAPAACAYTTASVADLIATCNPWANRKAGDFMVLWDQQGASLNLSVRTWSGTAPNLTLGAAQPLDGTVSEASYGDNGYRGEAAIDLAATVLKDKTDCTTFANTIPSTVTGNSDSADYKDTVFLDSPPISNCGSVSITKKDDDSPQSLVPDATFTLYKDIHPADTATGHIAEDTVTSYTCTTGATGTCTIAGVLLGDYWAVETTTPTGYATAADQKVHVTTGSSTSLTFVDPRQFTVITIVCRNSDNSLYPSTVALTGGPGSPKTSIATGDTGATLAAQLCATSDLGGASFTPKSYGSYTGSVTIPQ